MEEQRRITDRKNVLILELIQITSGLEGLSTELKQLRDRADYLVSMLKLLREMENDDRMYKPSNGDEA